MSDPHRTCGILEHRMGCECDLKRGIMSDIIKVCNLHRVNFDKNNCFVCNSLEQRGQLAVRDEVIAKCQDKLRTIRGYIFVASEMNDRESVLDIVHDLLAAISDLQSIRQSGGTK
jgi:hypothetical protein